MKIPRIKTASPNYFIAVLGEGDEISTGHRKIYCSSQEEVNQIVDYFLEHGKIKYYQESFETNAPDSLEIIDMGKPDYPSDKLLIWKKVGRIRKRPEKIGGNVDNRQFILV